MHKILDRIVILIACLASLFFVSFNTLFVVAVLSAIAVSFVGEIKFVPRVVSYVLVGVYLALSFFFLEFVVFVPLVAYVYLTSGYWSLRLIWIAPLVAGLRFFDVAGALFLVCLGAVSAILAFKTFTAERELLSFWNLRDELSEESHVLARKNRDLRDRQDMDVHVATLDERGRIAREIHDNVGHLLTRSVLQIEAFQVVYADNKHVRGDFEQVGSTVHEALTTVRASVHDLHDDSFDLQMQLQKTFDACDNLTIEFDYRAESIVPSVGYCFVAIAREALSNTLKHSKATKVAVSVLEQPGFYRLMISDDGAASAEEAKGSGMGRVPRPNQTHRSEGIGLRSMDERVRSLDGIFRVERYNGFRITATIPKQENVST